MAASLRLFINYRREDSSGYAGRIYDALVGRSSDWHVFMDIDTIDPGVDFVDVIDSALGSCDVVLAVIGRHWLDVRDSQGRRRLDEDDDLVRLELEAVLKRGIRVIPVLVQGATMPRASELPPGLAGLARRNAFELADGRWRYDIDQLVEVLERGRGQTPQVPRESPRSLVRDVDEQPTRRRLPAWALGAAAVALLAALGAGGFVTGRSSSSDKGASATAGRGGLDVSLPAGWHSTPAPDVAGIPLRSALAIAPAGSTSPPAVVTGTLGGSLAASMLAAPQVVRLGNIEAYRLQSDRRMYLIPRSQQPGVVACLDSVAPAECDRIAATISLSPSVSYPLASTARYKSALTLALSTLDRRVLAAAAALRKARTPASQVLAATAASTAYSEAARAVGSWPSSTIVVKDQHALVTALRTAATDFQELAATGRRDDASGWNRAARKAEQAEAVVKHRVLALSPLLLGAVPR